MKSKFEEALFLFQNNQLDKAKEVCLERLKENPNNYDILYLLGLVFFQIQNYEKSAEAINRAIKIKPENVDAYNSHAIALVHNKKFEEAIQSWSKAIEIKPDYAEAYYNRGNALFELKKIDQAIESFDKAIKNKPDYIEAYNNLGNIFCDLNRSEESLKSFDKAIEIKPDYAEAYFNRGNALKKFKRLNQAIASYDKAIENKFEKVEVYNYRGHAFLELKKAKDALSSYNKAIKINTDSANSHYNRGLALLQLKREKDAIDSFDTSIKIRPDYAEAYFYRGDAFYSLNKIEEALISYEEAYKINPNQNYLFGQLLFLKNNTCKWNFFEENLEKLKNEILNKKKSSPPFPLLSLIDSLKIHKNSAEIFLKSRYPLENTLEPISFRKPNKKIRIGYYSADFYNHAVSHLLVKLFELHDKSKFELIGFYFGPDKNDEMQKRISAAFDQFINVNFKNDKEVAQLSRELNIDIAVDLMGFTRSNRFGIFVEKCAPIQISYLGYSSTTGSNCIDYIIGDEILIPKENQKYYSEKIIYLPDSFMVNDFTKKISDKIFTRKEFNLPETAFIFCSFNKFYKIIPKVFDTWMKLLKQVEGSVLWLIEDNFKGVENLKEEANKRGIDSKRIIFAEYMKSHEDYLARYKVADLFIDTIPYNGHTRVSDALWAGLPVLTQIGDSFQSRVSASLLNALDLSELISHSEKQYEDLALKLATNKNELQEIKNKLKKNILKMPLFNTKIFTKKIETAFVEIHKRYLLNLPIDNIKIK